MGSEARCTVKCGGKTSEGKALLETDEILFRGDFRLSIPLKEIEKVEVRGGQLRIKSGSGLAVFDLGPMAKKWATKILHPKSRVEKLGVKLGLTVSLVRVRDDSFLQELKKCRLKIIEGSVDERSDMVFVAVERKEELKDLVRLRRAMKKDGTIWVIRPKGSAAITEQDVRKAARSSELVDIKVVRFSDTHTAEKLVIPSGHR